MSDWTDEQLRAGFRPAAPPRDLAPLVLARLEGHLSPRPAPHRPAWLIWAAALVLAAMLGGGLWVGHYRARQRLRAGRAAARQLAAALALAGRDLQTARRQLRARGE